MSRTYNKVVFGGTTYIDLSQDTVTASDVLTSKTFHDKNGAILTGTCEYDAKTSDATAGASEILATKTAYVAGSKVTGTMPNIGSQTGTITTKAGSVGISAGYHDGSGSVGIASVEQAKIIGSNIKNGVQILGVTGTYTGSELIKATVGSATPSSSSQTILPSSFGDYDYFTQFNVAAIPTAEAQTAGTTGYTITIG